MEEKYIEYLKSLGIFYIDGSISMFESNKISFQSLLEKINPIEFDIQSYPTFAKSITIDELID